MWLDSKADLLGMMLHMPIRIYITLDVPDEEQQQVIQQIQEKILLPKRKKWLHKNGQFFFSECYVLYNLTWSKGQETSHSVSPSG